MNKLKEKRRKDFERKYKKLPDLKKIRLQNFLLDSRIKSMIGLLGVLFYFGMGFILILPFMFLLMVAFHGFYIALFILAIMGVIFVIGAGVIFIIIVRRLKEDKRKEEKFLNETHK